MHEYKYIKHTYVHLNNEHKYKHKSESLTSVAYSSA